VILLPALAWAGTWRDDFEDGDLDGWREFQWIDNGQVEEKDGKLIVTDVGRSRVTLAFFNEGQIVKDFTLTIDAKVAKADVMGGAATYLWVVFRNTDEVFAYLGYEVDNNPPPFISIFQAQGAGFRWDIGRVNIPPPAFKVNQ